VSCGRFGVAWCGLVCLVVCSACTPRPTPSENKEVEVEAAPAVEEHEEAAVGEPGQMAKGEEALFGAEDSEPPGSIPKRMEVEDRARSRDTGGREGGGGVWSDRWRRHDVEDSEGVEGGPPHQLFWWSSLRSDGSLSVPRLLLQRSRSTASPCPAFVVCWTLARALRDGVEVVVYGSGRWSCEWENHRLHHLPNQAPRHLERTRANGCCGSFWREGDAVDLPPKTSRICPLSEPSERSEDHQKSW
jgi:hypothetical protein